MTDATTGPRMAAILEQERPGREAQERERLERDDKRRRQQAVLRNWWRSGCDDATLPSGVRLLLRAVRPRDLVTAGKLPPDVVKLVTSPTPWNFEDPTEAAAYMTVRNVSVQQAIRAVWDNVVDDWQDLDDAGRAEIAGDLPVEDADVLFAYVDIDPADRKARAAFLDAIEAVADLAEAKAELGDVSPPDPPAPEPMSAPPTLAIDDEDGDPS